MHKEKEKKKKRSLSCALLIRRPFLLYVEGGEMKRLKHKEDREKGAAATSGGGDNEC